MPKVAKHLAIGVALTLAVAWTAVTLWVAFPTEEDLPLHAPLVAATAEELGSENSSADLKPLVASFRPQEYRSFCGPASLATIIRAYGDRDADQLNIFPSWSTRLRVYYGGTTLAELRELAAAAGLQSQVLYADTLTLHDFRERLKENLAAPGDYVLINYSRKPLNQAGDGHISAIAAYDPKRDAFLVLDEASYRYPFTWIPAPLLYEAVHTLDGDRHRGLLLVRGFSPRHSAGNRSDAWPKAYRQPSLVKTYVSVNQSL